MESKGYRIFSDGVVLEPFQREDGSWGWYVVEFVMDSRTYLGNGQEEEVNVNAFAETKEALIEEFDEEENSEEMSPEEALDYLSKLEW